MLLKLDATRKLILLHFASILLLAEILPIWALVVSSIIYLYKFFNQRTTSRILKFASIMSLIAIVAYYRTLFNPEAAVSFMALISGLKLLELNNRRDFIIGYLLSFLLVACQALFFNSLFHFIFMFLISIMTLTLWWNYFEPSSGLVQQFKKSLAGVVIMLPMTIILFVLFPRFSTHFLSLASQVESSRIGFSDKVENDQVEELKTSSRIAFRAKLNVGKLPQPQLYWRGTINSLTDGYNWERNLDLAYPKNIESPTLDNEVAFDVHMDQIYQGILFSLDYVKYFQFSSQWFSPATDTLAIRSSRFEKVQRYIGYSKLKSENVELPNNHKYLQVSKNISPAVVELAKRLKQKMNQTHPQDILREYFLSQSFQYTLAPGKIKTLDQFLFKSKKGFCTHFASAAGILLRLMGVPARLVSGFQGGQWNDFGQYYIVTDNDAHTWVEFYRPELGWQRYDPTFDVMPDRITFGGEIFFGQPDQNFNPLNSPSIIKRNWFKLKLFADGINYRWTVLVDSIDKDFQTRLAEMMKIKLKKFYLIIVLVIIFTPLFIIWGYRLFKLIDFSFVSVNRLEKIERKLYKILDRHNIVYEKHDPARTLKNKINHQGLAEIYQLLEEIKYAPHSNLEPLYQQLKVLMGKLKF
jgi:protein-glutamine gamma-glutamyltransferase